MERHDSHAETTDPPGGGRPLDYVGTTNATPFGNRFRLRNRTIVRRDGGIADRTNTCIFVIFEKAAWWAGPVGILRCRITQRRQKRILDIPRAGAVLKARATSPNSVWWHLPQGVCGFCLARYHETDDPNDPGKCFWCSDNTLCPNCVIPITIALNDPRVSAICQERARYDQRTAFMMRDPFRKRRLHICQNCASCDNVLDREAISRHWPREYQRLLQFSDEMQEPEGKCVDDFFYFEKPFHNNPTRVFSCSRLRLASCRRVLWEWRSITQESRNRNRNARCSGG